ncbi:MAG TPA: ORC1-type DNA replication protein [Candidatus Nanoarchaeia archaeon]|nr:ORC1-type DNA replication protein [Candidatus Nanoarchaeia archaeon]
MNAHHSVFRDESKLDINFIPNRLPHRDKERRLLNEFFSFLLKTPDKMSQRVIVTGEIGTGKTALCQRFGQEFTLEAHKRNINLRYVHVNCREYRGKLILILQHALTVLKPMFPQRGYGAEEILKNLLQVLDEENAYLILALDEFDSLIDSEGSDAVYNLTRLQEMRQDKPQRISLICIMRNLDTTKRLDDSARSTLQRSVIRLQRYDKMQLLDILNDRVNLAFEPTAVPEDVVSLTADLAQDESGNARFAIELLWRAGKYADSEELETVVPECVRQAVSNIIPSVQRSELTTLGLHEKLFLLAAAEVFKENTEAYSTLTEIEKAYAVACEEYEKQPVSHTQLWTYLKPLSALGLLKTQVSGEGSRGRQTLVYLPAVSAVELAKELRAELESERGQ